MDNADSTVGQFDQAIATTMDELAAKLGRISEEPFIREAIVKMAVRDFSWAIVKEFDDCLVVAEQLETMSELIRNSDE